MVLVDLDGTTSAPPERRHPKFEWKDEGASHVLYVHLPGFVWEDLRLTYNEPNQSLTIEGTHTMHAYYSEFVDIDIRIPDSARIKERRSRFQKGTLIVTFPKQTLVSPPPPPLPPPPQAKDPVPIPTPRNVPASPPPPPPQAKDPIPIPTPPNEPSPPQAKEPVPIPTPRNESPPPQAKEPVPIPTPCNERLPPPLPLPPLPPQAKDPVPLPTPRNELPKVEERINEGPSERDSHVKLQPLGEKGADSGTAAATIHSTEMKVGREEERKLLVNVLMAAIVLVAIGAFIYATLTR